MKILILGANKVAATLAENLASEANDITLVDTNAEVLRDLKERLDIGITVGQPSFPDVLRRAGVSATLSEVARSSPYSLVIEVHTAPAGELCASAIATEVVAEVSGIPEADRFAPPGRWGSLLVGAMPLLSEKALVIRNGVEHDAAVRGALEQQVAAMAARIRSANQ